MRAKNEIREKENFLSDPTRKKNLPGFEKKNRLKSEPTIFATRFFSPIFFRPISDRFWKRPKFSGSGWNGKWRQTSTTPKKVFFSTFLAKRQNLRSLGFGCSWNKLRIVFWPFFWVRCHRDTQLQHFNACKKLFLLSFVFHFSKKRFAQNRAKQFSKCVCQM